LDNACTGKKKPSLLECHSPLRLDGTPHHELDVRVALRLPPQVYSTLKKPGA
jgi:hypothetical protein